jgi:hypothetical protein
MGNPSHASSAKISLSNTESSELASSGRRSNNSRENARHPVWTSESVMQSVPDKRQRAIGDVPACRHPTAQGLPAENARAEDTRVHAAADQANHRGDQFR